MIIWCGLCGKSQTKSFRSSGFNGACIHWSFTWPPIALELIANDWIQNYAIILQRGKVYYTLLLSIWAQNDLQSWCTVRIGYLHCWVTPSWGLLRGGSESDVVRHQSNLTSPPRYLAHIVCRTTQVDVYVNIHMGICGVWHVWEYTKVRSLGFRSFVMWEVTPF